MAEQIKVEKFQITITGDPSVGIFDQHYELGSEFYFEDENELREFKRDLQILFECNFGEKAYVETQEEIDAENSELEKLAKEVEEAEKNFTDEPITDEELENEIKKDWSLDK